MLLSLVSTITACFVGGTAAMWTSNSSRPFQNPTGASGPFDLAHTYPLYADGWMDGANSNTNCPWHNVYWQGGTANTLTGDIPVYMIYYGGGISDWQKGMMDIFAGNVKNNPIWYNVVSGRYGGGRPYFAGRYNVGCQWWCGSVDHGCFPCNLNQWNENTLLNSFFNQVSGTWIKNWNAIYVLVLGTDVTYRVTQTGGSILGSSQSCATHDRSMYDGGPGYRYLTIPTLKSFDSPCNFQRSIGFPNNWQIDNAVATFFHELVETVIPPYRDGCAFEVADKCANKFLNLASQGWNANVNVGGQRYLINPLWHSGENRCSMGQG